MRNILITVMMLIAVSVMFIGIVASEDGTKDRIEEKGTDANNQILNLNVD